MTYVGHGHRYPMGLLLGFLKNDEFVCFGFFCKKLMDPYNYYSTFTLPFSVPQQFDLINFIAMDTTSQPFCHNAGGGGVIMSPIVLVSQGTADWLNKFPRVIHAEKLV